MKHSTLRIFIFLILVVLMIALSFFLDFEEIISFSEGPFAPIIFLGIVIIARLLFAPGAIFAIAGGALFGMFLGSILVILGAIISAMIAFFLGRYLGRDFVNIIIGEKQDRIKKLNDKLKEKGFVTVFLLRLIPILPFTGLNLSLGITNVKARHYFFATCLGVIPGVLVYSNLGGAVFEFDLLKLIVAIILVLIVGVISWYYRKKILL